jgi:predicted ester cyclase
MMNKAEELARAVLAAMNDRRPDRVAELVTEDFVDHGAPPGVPQGRQGYVATLGFVTELLEIRYEVHDVVAAGDRVAIRATAHGVHNSGHLGFPATGRPYAMPTMHLYRAEGDLLAEHWGVRDELSALWQVGALERPPVPEIPAPALSVTQSPPA